MIRLNPATEPSRGVISFDSLIEKVAVGNIQIFQVVTNNHPRVCPGDILFVDDENLETCDERDLLMIDYAGTMILRQKKFVGAILRRSGIHAVGFERREHIKFIGRVIGWMHR